MKYIDKKIIFCALLCSTAPLLTEAYAGNNTNAVADLLQPIFSGIGKRIADGDRDNGSGSSSIGGLLNLGGGGARSGSVPALPQLSGLNGAFSGAAQVRSAGATIGGGAMSGIPQVYSVNGRNSGQVGADGAPIGSGGAMSGISQVRGINGGVPGQANSVGASRFPGGNGLSAAGGQGIVNNVTYNISNNNNNSINVALPEGYKQAVGADGQPLPIETKVGTDGIPLKVIQALNLQGEPVQLEQKMDITGQQSVVEYKTDAATGQIQTTVLPLPPQPYFGLVNDVSSAENGGISSGDLQGAMNLASSGITKDQLISVLENPYATPQTLAIYQQIEQLAQTDAEDKAALGDIKEFMPQARAATIRVAILEKYIDQILNNAQQKAEAEFAKQAAQQQSLLEYQQSEAKRKETIRQEIDRLTKENSELIKKLKGLGASQDEISAAYVAAKNGLIKPSFAAAAGQDTVLPRMQTTPELTSVSSSLISPTITDVSSTAMSADSIVTAPVLVSPVSEVSQTSTAVTPDASAAGQVSTTPAATLPNQISIPMIPEMPQLGEITNTVSNVTSPAAVKVLPQNIPEVPPMPTLK